MGHSSVGNPTLYNLPWTGASFGEVKKRLKFTAMITGGNMRGRIHPSTAILLFLALASCDGPSLTDKQRDEVSDICGDVASEAISDLESRVSDLEAR